MPPYKPETHLDDFNDESEDVDEKMKEDNSDDDFNAHEDEEEVEKEEVEYNSKQRKNKQAAPKIVDPYANDETSYLLPILITIGAFIPLLYCLCRL